MKTPQCVLAERRRMRARGFIGKAGSILSHFRDGRAHNVRFVVYEDDGVSKVFVEMWETHDRARRARIVPLCDLVHVMQNLSLQEIWEVARRRAG